jgi:hypothetical protein
MLGVDVSTADSDNGDRIAVGLLQLRVHNRSSGLELVQAALVDLSLVNASRKDLLLNLEKCASIAGTIVEIEDKLQAGSA